jgi:hypothetical protein
MNPNPTIKIPASLSIISYIFLTLGILVIISGFSGLANPMADVTIWSAIRICIGISYVCLSRGLRRCSYCWYIYALAIACFHLVAAIYVIYLYFGTQTFLGSSHPYRLIFFLDCILSFDLWVFLSLLRRDIRSLFARRQ